jgi:flagellar capping protein FliD
MGALVLKEEELEVIGKYVKTHLNEWLGDTNVIPFSKQIDMVERITNVESGINNLQEQIKQQMTLTEKQFVLMEKRFEQVDKRFEQVDKRFEQVDIRFKQMFAFFTTSFIIIAALMSLYQFLG